MKPTAYADWHGWRLFSLRLTYFLSMTYFYFIFLIPTNTKHNIFIHYKESSNEDILGNKRWGYRLNFTWTSLWDNLFSSQVSLFRGQLPRVTSPNISCILHILHVLSCPSGFLTTCPFLRQGTCTLSNVWKDIWYNQWEFSWFPFPPPTICVCEG